MTMAMTASGASSSAAAVISSRGSKRLSAQPHPQHSRRSSSSFSIQNAILAFSIGMAGFFAGTLYTMHAGVGKDHDCSSGALIGRIDRKNRAQQVEEEVQRRVQQLQSSIVPPCPPQVAVDPRNLRANLQQQQQQQQKSPLVPGQEDSSSSSSATTTLTFPEEMSKYLAGATRTSKMDFFEHLDLGVPMDPEHDGDSQVLILHQRSKALPSRFHEYSEPIPFFETAEESLQHCDMVNVLFMDHSQSRNQCLAIVPQYESYILQRFLRLPSPKDPKKALDTAKGASSSSLLSNEHPLRMVGRGMKDSGKDEFLPPTDMNMKIHMELLSTYFASLQESLRELKPLVERVATKTGKTVTVMVSNFGQSELLVNFVCAARSRNLDTSSILVFSTDVETKELAEHLGLAAFYDERNFGTMPQEAAVRYGDRKFTAMMMAKVFCVHMVSALNYNILFQDVDIVWYKDPIPFFETENLKFDLLFQDDGGHTVRYAPYSANSGFYYVRANPRTKYFFHSLLMAGDLIQKTDSHQQALIALLTDHSSLFGLQTKVFSRDSWEFPGGYQYHQRSGQYMRDLFDGKIEPYIFHMSWTLNKDNKLLYFRQMGEWYVQDSCVHQPVSKVLPVGDGGGDDSPAGVVSNERQQLFVSSCCSAQPLITCHYRDKPSVIPCKDSPPIDAGRPSFWK